MKRVGGSFRDPSGRVYERHEQIYRSVAASYELHYRQLVDSGLLDKLWAQGQLVRFAEDATQTIEGAWKTLNVEKIGYITHPFEWSFSQLQDAALLTLDIQSECLQHGMILKDASAYNIAFAGGRPVLIDCLSFERWTEGQPWQAYQQFCKHFLAPLFLLAKKDLRLHRLTELFIDGLPLDLVSRLLPVTSYLSIPCLLHIHAHAKVQSRYNDALRHVDRVRSVKVGRQYLLELARQLRKAIGRLRPHGTKTTWGRYYNECNYSDEASAAKAKIVGDINRTLSPGRVLDLGANDGHFSRIAAAHAGLVVSSDFDPIAVDTNYRIARDGKLPNVQPLILDIVNPSTGVGWAGNERLGFVERSDFDLVMALALVHHLAITNQVPLPMIAAEFERLGRHVLVEFVPPDDVQTQRIAAMQSERLADYSEPAFLSAFGERFDLVESHDLPTSGRRLYLFRRKN